jgi:hypothetical protein
MEIPKLPDCNTVLVFGPVSSGKSHLMQLWITAIERSLTIDTTAECMDESFTHVWGNPKELLTKLAENPYFYRLAYHPSSRNFLTEFKWAVEGIWLSGKQENGKLVSMPRWLIVEEVHEVCNNSSITEEMELVIRYARHNLLGFIGTTHRFADIHRLMTSNCRMIILFHTLEPNDLEAIRHRLGKSVETQVRELRPLLHDDSTKITEQEPECLVWIRGKGTRIFALGDKIKTIGDNNQWVNNSKVVPQTPQASSLDHNSGKQEPKLPEPILGHGRPQ